MTLPGSPPFDPIARFRLDGKVAVVTGASSGLGARFARVLDAAGARVVIAARRLDRLEALAAELRDAVVVVCDLREPGAPEALIESAVDRAGRLDVLVNNAGVTVISKALDETTEIFESTVRLNLVVPFVLAREAARHMIERPDGTGGVVVNIASLVGLVASGRIPQASYAASKHGIVGLTRELAAQWARKGVRVNAIAPGWFESEMTRDMFHGDRHESSQAYIAAQTPMGRAGAADELDGVLVFLASSASSFVTGQVISVDGGWTIV